MTSTAASPPMPHAAAADAAVRDVLLTQYAGERAVVVSAAPGAGKTDLVERLAVQEMALFGGRVMVATQTNEQAFDVARRFARDWPRHPLTLFVREDLTVPPDLFVLPTVQVARRSNQLPPGPCIAVANAKKWSWIDDSQAEPFTLLVVDEAYQLPDYGLHQIAGLAERLVLVGDPGQIAPLVTCEIERWRCDLAGPHVACPHALVARHPGVPQLSLPVSRRLLPDTVALVQALYPQLPLRAYYPTGARRLLTPVLGMAPLDRAINLVTKGASVVQLELPPAITGTVDGDAADTTVALIESLCARGAEILDGGHQEPLTPAMIGVVCAHRGQVTAINERMPSTYMGLVVETSNRFQGLERPIMVMHHPLSGRADADTFHIDAGRLCVMLSRHRLACFVITRGGVEDMLRRHAPSGDRVLGMAADAEFEGWHAHRMVLETLRNGGRVVSLS